MSAPTLSPTTGEPVEVVGRRNRVGLLVFIIADLSGSLALIISYSYLWSLNVNGAWAPANTTYDNANNVTGRTALPWAPDWPFWAVLALTVVATLLMWWGYRGIRAGRVGQLTAGAALSTVVILGSIVLQWWQMSTFPFDATNGAYASAVLLMTGSALVHLFLVGFLVLGVTLRTRAGAITADNHSQARLVNYYMAWICASLLLSCLVTTFMKASPNVNPPVFGSFSTQK